MGQSSKILRLVGRYTISVYELEDGKIREERECEGFSAIELLGRLERLQMEIIMQMSGEMSPPDIVKRTVVERGE